jgi:hypothetical protein
MSFVLDLTSSRPASLAPLLGAGLLLLGAHVGCTDQSTSGVPDSALAAGGAGAGGTAGSTTTDAGADTAACVIKPSVCDSNTDPIEPATIISDFESGSDLLPSRDGRMGAWWTAGDKTIGAVISPQGAARPEPIPGGRCGSQKALHVTGSGFTDWGATLGAAVNYGPNDAGVPEERPWDGSAYKGLTFWAKIGDTSTNSVRLAVSDQYARPEAGLCVVDGPVGKGCYDTFGTDLPNLDTTWRKYKVSFASMEQRGFGVPSPSLDTKQIYQIEFAMLPGAIFDFWLDDLTLY